MGRDARLSQHVVVARIDYHGNEIDDGEAPPSAGLPRWKFYPAVDKLQPPGNKPAPARASALAPPPAKKMATNPYVAFCRQQRPLLPAGLRNAEREQTLGMRIGYVDTVLTRRAIGEPEEQAVQPRGPSGCSFL